MSKKYITVAFYRATNYPGTARVVQEGSVFVVYITHNDIGTVYYGRCDSFSAAIGKIRFFLPKGCNRVINWKEVEDFNAGLPI